ncbi:oxidoreductase family protein [Xylariaceae sp. FL0016]|nr:oxidoreductase family protein [Xylariaceae sp. FL0016]
MAEKQSFNVGVIGYGLSASVFHIPFITTTPSLTLHSILQRKPSDSSSAPRDYPDLKHHTSLDTLLADAELDVVVVTTPPETHFPFTRAALEAGKHVFVEKPFVPSVAEADELIRLAESQHRRVCVYQNRRWDSDFLTVRRLLAEGRLGRVVEFETHFDRYRAAAPTNWKGALRTAQGGGPLYDLGSHLLDQAYALFGMPVGVFAKLVSQRDGALVGPANPDLEPDSVNITMTYADGMIAHVRIGVLSVETRQPRFWIRGTKASYHKHGLDTQEPQLRAGMKTSDPEFGREPPECDGKLMVMGNEGQVSEENCPNVVPETYGKIYELFAQSLSGKGDVPVPATQARDVLRIIEAARESAKTCREIQLS